MKWSLSEIKKHAKTTGQIASLFDTFIEKIGSKDLRVQKWVPLEDVINLENELRAMQIPREKIEALLKEAQEKKDFKRFAEVLLGASFSNRISIDEVLGEVKP